MTSSTPIKQYRRRSSCGTISLVAAAAVAAMTSSTSAAFTQCHDYHGPVVIPDRSTALLPALIGGQDEMSRGSIVFDRSLNLINNPSVQEHPDPEKKYIESCSNSKLVLQRVAGNKLIVVQPQQRAQRQQHVEYQQKKRQVKFSTLTVRSYPRCPGYFHVTSDSGGPPISMELNHQSEITYQSIEVYETKTTKLRSVLKVSSMERDDLLRRHGYSLAERQKATKQSTITRNQRKKSNRGSDGSTTSFLGLHFKSFKNNNRNRNRNRNKTIKIASNN